MRLRCCFFLPIIAFCAPALAQQAFPDDWLGQWWGTLAVERGRDTLMTTRMQLGIARADAASYTWSLSYGPTGADDRPYRLERVDSAGTHWRIDERNGIVLDAYLHGGVLYSCFSVMGSRLYTRDELRGDTLYHEIVSGPVAGLPTGDTVLAATADTIPPVDSHRLPNRQSARLVRAKSP